MKVLVTPQARHDLLAIKEYIAVDSPLHGEKTIRRIAALIDECGDFPFSGRIVPEYGQVNLRERLFKSYRVIYRIEDDHLEVIAIVHTARLLRLE